ncbi:MAG: hypothetical protein B7Z55_00685, partial [Planctomycetales bacterium 12-60-4]
VFALPFVLLSGVCGVLADRYSKRAIVVLSKVLEVAAMLLGALAFASGSLVALMAVLSLMGAQSAFFGPAKYGILPELFRPSDLPRANGLMLMTTFVSIILGITLAGYLTQNLAGRLWLASVACIAIAVLGTATALPIRRTPIAHPGLAISWDSLAIPAEARRLLWGHPTFLAVLAATSVFWCVGGVYQQGVNDLGILQLGIGEKQTGILGACAAIGIAIGCVAAGKLSQGRFEARLVIAGQWGMIACLTLLSLPGPLRGNTLLGVAGAGLVLVALGASAGVFAVPLTVFLQALTPSGQKGQMIGVMNLVNWIGILASGLLHLGGSRLLAALKLPPNLIFLVGAGLLIPLVVWYRPVSRELTIT